LILLEICLVKAKTKGGWGEVVCQGQQKTATPASYTCTLLIIAQIAGCHFCSEVLAPHECFYLLH